MNKIFRSYIYFDGLEMIVHYHISICFNKKQTHYLKTPKNYQISEMFEMCCFLNRQSIECNLDLSLIATNINYSENIELFNNLYDELNIILFSSQLEFNKLNYLANSLYFLNHNRSEYELIYNKESQKYYSDLFVRENVETDNYKLLGAIHYFNFMMKNR